MKTTKMIFAAVILMVTMISTSVNSQTLVRGTDYTVTGALYVDGVFGASTTVLVNFAEPCNLTAFTGNTNYVLLSITFLNSTGKITSTSELLSGNTLTKSYNKVVSMTLKITATAPAFTLTGTKAPITISTAQYTAADTLKAYNNGYAEGLADGKATCNGTKTEVLKSTSDMSVYPNPVSDNVTVEFENNNYNTEFSNEAPGMYIIQITNINGQIVKTGKMIKQ